MAKTKYVTYECPYCHKQTKMEVLAAGNENQLPQGKQWYRCTRCKHSVLLQPADIEAAKAAMKATIVRENCIPYSNDKTYTIGQDIYHSEWDDVGRVIRKERTSGGIQIIVVAFEKAGEKRLVENMPVEIEEENSIS